MFPRCLQYLLTDFRQTFVTGASWDTDDLITFLGQKVKVQGHTIAAEAQHCYYGFQFRQYHIYSPNKHLDYVNLFILVLIIIIILTWYLTLDDDGLSKLSLLNAPVFTWIQAILEGVYGAGRDNMLR